MRIISWNVNGLRSCLGKGFADFFNGIQADAVCLQEIKCEKGQADFSPGGYHQYWNSAQRRGYSGTLIFSKKKPISCFFGIGAEQFDGEGRVITLEYDEFHLVNCYTPNSQRELTRIDYRMDWEDAFLDYLKELDAKKPVVLCGDLNVAHREIDIKNPKSNVNNAGFTPMEREKMTRLLSSGFADSFRMLNPDKTGAYSWWSYMSNARERNIGWRIDYFIVSDALKGKVNDSVIYPDVMGSDHCPVGIEISVT